MALTAALCAASVSAPASAQIAMQSRPVVGNQALNTALARLGRNPRDLTALIDAGHAALAMGDVDAAVGFFARADQLSPENMRVKAGLAGALVRSENPYDAIPLFAAAEKAGGIDPLLLSDRGLAYDLVGDNATAQGYYRQALGLARSDETIRRLALSQAIAGNRSAMEATLSPLLQRQDKAAWRTRAFALAILRRPEEAVNIAKQTMPAEMANGIAPYLRYMPRLTPAQQAAAANFGRFPRAADIGRDDPRVARYAPAGRSTSVDAGLVPAGEPLGRTRPGLNVRGDSRRVAVATRPLPSGPPPAARVAAAPPEPVPSRQTGPVTALATLGSPSRTPGSSTARAAPVPGTRIAAPAARALPVPAPAAPVASPRLRKLADAFADFVLPSAPVAPPPGAVDVRRIAAARPKPVEVAKPAPPAKPAHPSRIWIQIGTGRDVKALGFTWRTLAKDNAELFKGKSPATSEWGRTNRLLTGPFATEAAASSYLSKLKKAKVDAFVWTSPAGQVVDGLAG